MFGYCEEIVWFVSYCCDICKNILLMGVYYGGIWYYLLLVFGFYCLLNVWWVIFLFVDVERFYCNFIGYGVSLKGFLVENCFE